MQVTRARPTAPPRHMAERNGHAPASPSPPRRRRVRRATVLVGRLVLWAAILALAVRGGVATVAELRGPPAPAGVAAPQPAGTGFPVDAARALATRFAHDYLAYDPADDTRPDRLAAYLPGDGHGELGWDRNGEQAVHAVVALDVTVETVDRAAVLVAAQVSGPRWLHLSVPVVADREGRLAVGATPTLVAAPQLADQPPAEEPAGDKALSKELVPVLESFFDAYGAGRADDLAYYLPVGRTMGGLDGTVELDDLVDLWVAEGSGVRHAQATVRWRDTATGARLTQRYDLRLVDNAGRWYVDALGAQARQRTDGNGQGERDDR
ncbi:MAG TPA: conjugal transfer protein [Egibacteraceae bacterium]|nr:conjugal transfer protein [Egibacteraceae bacterium]